MVIIDKRFSGIIIQKLPIKGMKLIPVYIPERSKEMALFDPVFMDKRCSDKHHEKKQEGDQHEIREGQGNPEQKKNTPDDKKQFQERQHQLDLLQALQPQIDGLDSLTIYLSGISGHYVSYNTIFSPLFQPLKK